MQETSNATSSINNNEMKVLKRNNVLEEVSFDKILNRVKKIGKEFNVNINYSALVMKVIDQLYSGIPTRKIDELTAEQCASMCTQNPDYGTLAGIIVVSNHQKSTPSNFKQVVESLYHFKDVHSMHSPLVSNELFEVVSLHHEEFENLIDYKRDYLIDYFGFKTLERAYLLKVNKIIVERPQHMWMRVAIGIHGYNLEKVKQSYDLMSQKYFTHATPTLFNAGTPRPQLSSCYLLSMESDSIDGIYNTLKDCAKISKWAGGIGLHIHNVRGTGSHIRGTNGISNGIVPMLRVFNMTARYVDQCVTPETIIYTTKGPIEIQNCSLGETQIYNLKGDVETIENVLEHPYDGEILNIKTSHAFEELHITPEHPVYAFQNKEKEEGNVNWTLDDIENKLNNKLQTFEWIDAKDLTINDFLVYKIPNYSVDLKNISEDDCYMYGIMLAYGSMSNNGSGSDEAVITLRQVQDTNNSISNFIIKYFQNKCVECKVNYNSILSDELINIYWKKSLTLPFRYNDFYDSNNKLHLHSKWLNLPIEKSKYIIKGLLCGNVNITNQNHYDSITLWNDSKQIIESARFIFMKMGILTSGYAIESLRKYYLNVPRCPEILDLMDIKYNGGIGRLYLRYNDFLICRIENISKSNHSGVLYDLQMKDEHNYMLHNGIVHNGGGKRNGSFAIYIEPWHTDIIEFLELRKNHGDEELRCRDLFLALWTPDLFMERVKTDGNWSLFCPDQCPGLSDCYGDEFKALYEKYENEGKTTKTMKARTLWFKVLDAQMETGTPYILFKDAANKKSNQKNLGVIKSSNLCTEIMEYSSPDETAVCNLASVALNRFVGPEYPIHSVKLYTKTSCNYCVKVKNILKLNNILYEEIILDNDSERLEFYDNLSNDLGVQINSVPQIYINNKHIGGYDKLVEELKPHFHYDELHKVTKIVTENLNKVIDINYYPTDKTLRSNMRHRPIGIGVQGLADTFFKLDIPFHSEEAIQINKQIFETIYHASLEKSLELSIERKTSLEPLYDYFNNYTPLHDDARKMVEQGQLYNKDLHFENKIVDEVYHQVKPIANELFCKKSSDIDLGIKCRDESLIGSYSSFIGSPTSNGILQFDMWNVIPSDRYDWNTLKQTIKQHGIRNSLLVAPMPTASTSQILGNNECFEPVTSNIYTRRTLAGEFVIANKYLMNDLIQLGHWDESIKNNIIANKGSIQQLDFLPQHIRDKYKIVWEIPMKHLIDMSRDRGAYICQSQSLNLWVEDPDYKTLTSMHFYSHQNGLKTGIYYLRRKPKHDPQQFTIEPEKKSNQGKEEEEYEICEMCSG